MIRLVTCLSLLLASSFAQADRLDPYSAEFELYRGGTTLGDATLSLEQTSEHCFVHSYTAKPSWLFRWATGKVTERSEFCELESGHLQPKFFRYHRSGIGADDENFSLDFDAEKRLVTDDKGVEREWPEGAVDRLMVQLEALRMVYGMPLPIQERRLNVTVVNDDDIKEYTLAVTGEETIKVPAGEFKTIRVERINDPKKTTRFWVAPELDYRLIKVEQQRKDDPVVGFALKSLPQALEPTFTSAPTSKRASNPASQK